MNCKKCGKEIDKKAVVCPGCGCKIKKPIFKKWWFWVIVLIVVVAAMSSGGSNGVFFKFNTWGEDAFLDKLIEALDKLK